MPRLTAAQRYTKGEGAQVFTLGRWRNGDVSRVSKDGLTVEVTVSASLKVTLSARSPELRKWGEGKLARDKPASRGRAQRIRYVRAGYTGAPRKP
jgi:hypothetical protein